ncbi:hypothetical protein NQ318_000858 [Aromia moschata]|uniref:Uncharacterized protein n=1 Tax=Aromia moschata TaxID=1265417 RepID=A0AAV8XNW7_9CUCU|nr:hypothetical protein NQ318_000858 [Aromia moschata]
MESKHRNRTDRVTWYTDGSKTQQGTGAGIYNETEKLQYSIPLGKYASVFQAEVYAIAEVVPVNLRVKRNAWSGKCGHFFDDGDPKFYFFFPVFHPIQYKSNPIQSNPKDSYIICEVGLRPTVGRKKVPNGVGKGFFRSKRAKRAKRTVKFFECLSVGFSRRPQARKSENFPVFSGGSRYLESSPRARIDHAQIVTAKTTPLPDRSWYTDHSSAGTWTHKKKRHTNERPSLDRYAFGPTAPQSACAEASRRSSHTPDRRAPPDDMAPHSLQATAPGPTRRDRLHRPFQRTVPGSTMLEPTRREPRYHRIRPTHPTKELRQPTTSGSDLRAQINRASGSRTRPGPGQTPVSSHHHDRRKCCRPGAVHSYQRRTTPRTRPGPPTDHPWPLLTNYGALSNRHDHLMPTPTPPARLSHEPQPTEAGRRQPPPRIPAVSHGHGHPTPTSPPALPNRSPRRLGRRDPPRRPGSATEELPRSSEENVPLLLILSQLHSPFQAIVIFVFLHISCILKKKKQFYRK